jgi:hypothetical protein
LLLAVLTKILAMNMFEKKERDLHRMGTWMKYYIAMCLIWLLLDLIKN